MLSLKPRACVHADIGLLTSCHDRPWLRWIEDLNMYMFWKCTELFERSRIGDLVLAGPSTRILRSPRGFHVVRIVWLWVSSRHLCGESARNLTGRIVKDVRASVAEDEKNTSSFWWNPNNILLPCSCKAIDVESFA
jgi:hypothetical protein